MSVRSLSCILVSVGHLCSTQSVAMVALLLLCNQSVVSSQLVVYGGSVLAAVSDRAPWVAAEAVGEVLPVIEPHVDASLPGLYLYLSRLAIEEPFPHSTELLSHSISLVVATSSPDVAPWVAANAVGNVGS